MRAIMIMYDSLNRRMLEPYGCDWTHTKNFQRLKTNTVTFDNCYVGSMPCMPARRELHTGRYNFLHRSWGPLEPFDDSMPQILSDNKIHSHLSTDHYHYFEDGGATYHSRYRTWEGFRGQEGDAWKGVVGFEDYDKEHRNSRSDSWVNNWAQQDFINRSFMKTEDDQPQGQTFKAGIDFINANHDKDDWFLHIETFDPHEPFFTQQKYKDLYPHEYKGRLYDWPEYRPLNENDDEVDVNHLRMEYAALLSMCDDYLGRVLDLMDTYNMWEDTMLIVNTDHGFLLSEHGMWAKCHCPFYNEVAHTPLFIWDPRLKQKNKHVQSLVQTIDLPATILEYFNINRPKDMQGVPLRGVMEKDTPVRKGALFGIHGGQVNCTDGRYLYMRSPVKDNKPLYQYTLMPTRHGGRRAFIDNEELETLELHEGFSFTKGLKVMRTEPCHPPRQHGYETQLFDSEKDPEQQNPIKDEKIEQYMIELMKQLMKENDCPSEQFIRLGIED